MEKKISLSHEKLRNQNLAKVKDWDLSVIRQAKVMVVGAGALGNEVMKNLALLGVGEIIIVDFDQVEISNLSRSILFREQDAEKALPKAHVAADRIHEINSEIKVWTLTGDVTCDLGLGLLEYADVVIGCLDNRLARLYLNRLCFRMGKPWVNGGILNLSGQAEIYFPEKSCYECSLTAKGWEDIRFRMGCTDMARRFGSQGILPTTPISASIIGAIQVQEALKLVLGQYDDSLIGQKFYYEGQKMVAGKYQMLPPKGECGSHSVYAKILDSPTLSSQTSLTDFFATAAELVGSKDISLELDVGLVLGLASKKSGKSIEVCIPKGKLTERLMHKLEIRAGEKLAIPPDKLVFSLKNNQLAEDFSLSEIGIPFFHVIRLVSNGKRYYLRLSGDHNILNTSLKGGKLPIWSPKTHS